MADVALSIVNPNVAANTAINLPDGYTADAIISAALLDTGDYPDTAAVAPVQLAVVAYSGALAAGQIALKNPYQVTCGTATTDGYQTLQLLLRRSGTQQTTTYSLATTAQQPGPGY